MSDERYQDNQSSSYFIRLVFLHKMNKKGATYAMTSTTWSSDVDPIKTTNILIPEENCDS